MIRKIKRTKIGATIKTMHSKDDDQTEKKQDIHNNKHEEKTKLTRTK